MWIANLLSMISLFSRSLPYLRSSSTYCPPISFSRLFSMSEADIISNAHIIQERIQTACQGCNRDPNSVQLVAVSKTKPASCILALYEAGFRHFGENYYQELSEKAPTLPKDIKWHFIGHLQSSKASKLIKDVPNLYSVHTVDSEKLATKLNNAIGSNLDIRSEPLNVMIQVITSEEDSKSGVTETEAVTLARYILTQCPHLRFSGLMTIGAPGDASCFQQLAACRVLVASECGLEEQTVQLSMGMSGDFEQAIVQGAQVVRVGSTIFGPRIYAK